MKLTTAVVTLAATAATLLLAACSGTLLPQPAAAPARFMLLSAPGSVYAAAAAAATAHAASPPTITLTIDVPRAAPGYDSRQMVYLRRPQELEAFAFHEWLDAPASMLAPGLVRALQDSAAFRVVLLAPSAAAGGWRLETELLRLHQDFTVQPSQVRLGLRAVLVDSATRRPIAWREFAFSVATVSDDPVAGAASAQVAAMQLLDAVAAFCAEQAHK